MRYRIVLPLLLAIAAPCGFAMAQSTPPPSTDTTIIPLDAPKQPAYDVDVLQRPYDRKLHEHSKNAPTTFVVPEAYAAAVFQKAQDLVAGWQDIDMVPMKVHTSTATKIETEEPLKKGQIGFSVSRVKTEGGEEFTVKTRYHHDMTLHNRDETDSQKRAAHLAYILQQYALSLSVQAHEAAVAALITPEERKRRADMDALLTKIRSLIAVRQYDAANVEVDKLKVLLQQSNTPSTASPSEPAKTNP